MEALNKRLASELEATKRQHAEQMNEMKALLQKGGVRPENPIEAPVPPAVNRGVGDGPAPSMGNPGYDDVETPVPDYTEGVFSPYLPPSGFPVPTPPGREPARLPLNGTFGPGFRFQTENQEFRLQLHIGSQFETRLWGDGGGLPGSSGVFLPRQRLILNGNITKPVEYEFAINRGLNSFDLLNAFVNLHFDDRFQLRIGRYFTPLTYDQYAIPTWWMPTPERSLYTTNVGLNRQVGIMGWGYLFDERLDYAAGFFNGSRNSFQSLNNGADFVGYLNVRPFQHWVSSPARFLNMGSSVSFGYQDQNAVPVAFRVGAISPDAVAPGVGTVPFLILNPGVIERGNRLLGSVHSAYYYRSLSLIGEWQYGYGNYSMPGRPTSTQVPFSGFYATAGYFLTGEQVERRTWVDPLRPFVPLSRNLPRGPGAWEAVARVSRLGLGDQIFKGGFADPNLWSNSAITTEVGLNWYWNRYVKVSTFWLHGAFGEPVTYRPGDRHNNADMFWTRFQLYF